MSLMVMRRRSSGAGRKSRPTWTLPDYVKKVEAELRQIQRSSGLRIQEATITVGVTSSVEASAGAGLSVFEISGSASRSQNKTVTLKVSLDDSDRIQIATSNRAVRQALMEVEAGVAPSGGGPRRAPAKKATKRAPAKKAARTRA